MANHKSAEKRHRQNLKKRDRNRNAKATIRTALKNAKAAAESKDIAKAEEFEKKVVRLLDKADVQGVMHKNTVARTKSRLRAHIVRAQNV
ncbi:MAG: 30S ribosomal protein S20 [Bdellovibrionales bacterium]|nr:30S ribosomal protein S20 [Bdellovibrionales bacterium]